MKRTLVIVLLVIGCQAPATRTQAPQAEPERPGSQAVYQQIDAATDCAELQEIFDQANTNNGNAAPGTDQYAWTLGYMTAADERMRDLGCY